MCFSCAPSFGSRVLLVLVLVCFLCCFPCASCVVYCAGSRVLLDLVSCVLLVLFLVCC